MDLRDTTVNEHRPSGEKSMPQSRLKIGAGRIASMRILRLSVFCLALISASQWALAADDSLASANTFLRLIQSGEFGSAARAFQYPPGYTAEELREDHMAMARGLESLLSITGRMKGKPKQEAGIFVTYFVSLKGGSRAHPLPPSDPSNSAGYRFAVPLENYVDAAFHVDLERVAGAWKVREFKLALPNAGADSRERVTEILAQLKAAVDARAKRK
jgi:hypothetical protein